MDPQQNQQLTDKEVEGVRAVASAGIEGRQLRYYDYCMAAFTVVLVCANLIGAVKVASFDVPLLGALAFGGGVLFFPLNYVLGDVLTEVYGYARARRVLWVGFGACIFAAAMAAFVVAMPADPDWEGQEAFAFVMGQAPRIAFASVLGFWAGEFTNAYVLARMKLWTKGKHLWSRTIGSTVLGQAVDSVIFYPVAFLGVWPLKLVLVVMVSNYLLKVLWEALLTPVTYRLVAFLKKAEGMDVYDVDTNFSPFRLKV